MCVRLRGDLVCFSNLFRLLEKCSRQCFGNVFGMKVALFRIEGYVGPIDRSEDILWQMQTEKLRIPPRAE